MIRRVISRYWISPAVMTADVNTVEVPLYAKIRGIKEENGGLTIFIESDPNYHPSRPCEIMTVPPDYPFDLPINGVFLGTVTHRNVDLFVYDVSN